MRQVIATLLFLLGVALLIAGISYSFFSWASVPGGVVLVLVAAFVGLTQLGEGLKAWVEMLFGSRENTNSSSASTRPIPGISIRRNFLWGKNKIRVRRENSEVSNNQLLGENEIEVGAKPGPKPKQHGGTKDI
jgi:hypothetical protein